MLTNVEVTNSRGNLIALSIEEGDNPYQVKDIDGLDPVQASLSSTDSTGIDGQVFQGAKRGARNITIKLELDPDFVTHTFTSLRQGLYPFFLPKSQIMLRFYTDTGLYVDIAGVVEDFISPLFQKEPTVDISIMCFLPDFEDPRIVTVEGFTVDDTTSMLLEYPGSVESGAIVTLNVNRPATDFTIYNVDGGGNTLQLDFTGVLEDGDTLVVSSRQGAKGITLTRDGVSSSYLYGRSAQSDWIDLNEGDNNFRIYAPGDPIPYVLEYRVKYGGL